ncbi:MAG: hypothetical protein IK066_09330, partial [Kiritimatiellae bacterium]|nr:hypothetical protein [Kiritimatiellia bacterium]
GWWWSWTEGGGEGREGWDELAGMAAPGMSAEQLEVWAELCGERLEEVEWTEENREEIVGLLIRKWALEEFGHARGGGEGDAKDGGGAPEPPGELAEGEGDAKDGGGAPEPPVGERIREGWKGWAWKTDPAVPEIEREFCALLAGEEDGWDEWREKWGEDACGELMVDGMGAWAVALAARADEQRWHGQWSDYREELHRGAVEAFRKGKGFCAYRLVALLKGLAECVVERERMEDWENGDEGAEPAVGARRAADDTAWAEWADWATRAASGWRWAERDAAWLRMELARRTGDAERAAREARAVLANHGEELWRWGREDVDEVSTETVMALLSGGNWEGLAEVLRQVAERGDEDGIGGLCELADFLDAGAVAGMRDLAERWVLAEACKGAEGLMDAAWTWWGFEDIGAWTQARLAELETSGAWNSVEGERFAREAQERQPTLRGAGILIRRAAARGDAAEAWRVWCGVAGEGALWADWDSDEPAVRAVGEALRQRLLEMARWCGEVPEEHGEEVEEAWERVGREE